MDYKDIMKLLDAGYSREEIIAMQGDTQEQSTDAQEQSIDTQEQSTDTQEQSTDINAITNALGEMREMFEGFKKELTAMNILNSQIENHAQSADDIIANIINPFGDD